MTETMEARVGQETQTRPRTGQVGLLFIILAVALTLVSPGRPRCGSAPFCPSPAPDTQVGRLSDLLGRLGG